MQRFFDIVFSSLALLFLFPLFFLVGLALRLTGEGEVFFLQERVGLDGRLFKLYKFATMVKDSPNIGTGTLTTKNDPRVLPFGRLLRKIKINELPQLLNILRGDMSVVGPRPQAQRCFNAYPLELQKIITQVRPGLSGIGPIVFRDEERIIDNRENPLAYYDAVISPYKATVEAWYVKNQCLNLYFQVIAITTWVVLFPKSGLVWQVFRTLPAPPIELRSFLNYR
jgi:lipopolysaccharide/colanic/teichoic acid biosynthesis glycosyltransferase